MKKKKRGTITWFVNHVSSFSRRLNIVRRLLRSTFGRAKERSEIAGWLVEVQHLIGKHSTEAKYGPNKAHARTDSVAWVADLARLVAAHVEAKNRGRHYDENMALASGLGLILVAWYAHVHRAKSYDPNRPLKARQAAAAQRTRFLAELAAVLADDSVMGEVWGKQQAWNFPFGRGAKGGRFV